MLLSANGIGRWAVVASIVLLMLGSCTVVHAASAEPVTLEIWAAGQVGIYFETIKDDFQKLYPNVKLKILTMDPFEVANKVFAAVAAGTGAPDIAYVVLRRFDAYAESGVMLDVTDRLKKDGWLEKLHPVMLDLATYGGKVFAVPVEYAPTVVFYRKDVMASYGIDVDEAFATFPNLIEAGKKTRPHGQYMFNLFVPSGPWGVNFWNQFFMTRGGNVFDSKGSVIRNNTTAVETLKWMYDLKAVHDVAHTEVFFGADHWQSLSKGVALTYMTGLWGEGHLKNFVPDWKGKWAVKPWPLWSADAPKLCAQWGQSGLAIPRTSKHKDEAWALIRYVLEHPEGWYNVTGSLPALKGIESHPIVQTPGPITGQPLAPILAARTLAKFRYLDWAITEQIIGQAIDEVFSGKRSAEDAWKAAERRLVSELGR